MNNENIVDHQFQPGQSGNPLGRPKGSKNLKTIIREALNQECEDKNGETTSIKAMVVRSLFEQAVKKQNVSACRYLLEKVYSFEEAEEAEKIAAQKARQKKIDEIEAALTEMDTTLFELFETDDIHEIQEMLDKWDKNGQVGLATDYRTKKNEIPRPPETETVPISSNS